MPKLKFVLHDGSEFIIEAQAGHSIMEAAVRNMIPGIDADCGGSCACATCHVYVDTAYLEKTGSPEPMELSMLDFVSQRKSNSRLSCQITLTADMDGLVLFVPETQG